MNTIKEDFFNKLCDIPFMDVHTHLDGDHPVARGLSDILLYHMVISDLVSAGCPSRTRLPEFPSPEESSFRIEEAIPYLPYIQNTAMFWGIRTILRDLYEWDEPITLKNWRELDNRITVKAYHPNWGAEIAERAKIRRASTELWRRHDGKMDQFFQYSLEWAFFTRSQWGVNDIPLIELERAWNQPGPSEPLPVMMGKERAQLKRSIQTLEDVHLAIQHYVDHIPFHQIISTAQHISTEIQYRLVDASEMEKALKLRQQATTKERDIYACYILEKFLKKLEEHAGTIVYHFSIGAEPLPFETGSKLVPDTIFELAAIIERHPSLRFQALLASEHSNQALCTLARELPNLSLAGYWWHNFFPGSIQKIMRERLDMLASNSQIGFFSDAYCLDWAYAKSFLVRKQWAEVMAEKIESRQYNFTEALDISLQIFYQTPQTLLGMEPPTNDRSRSIE